MVPDFKAPAGIPPQAVFSDALSQMLGQVSGPASPNAPLERSQLTEALSQLHLSYEFSLACQSLTRRSLYIAQGKRDRSYQQLQFARRAENRSLSQAAQRHSQGDSQVIEQLQAQLERQTQQAAALGRQLQALSQVLGLAASPPEIPPGPGTVLVPPQRD
ncbi:MAG: hypothetical protein HC824_14005 [Synechococcales cyanobacterium RM1_1_8]|nr:hypothetical protein [Synechococcales cyanobacterium RM1_1_8]